MTGKTTKIRAQVSVRGAGADGRQPPYWVVLTVKYPEGPCETLHGPHFDRDEATQTGLRLHASLLEKGAVPAAGTN